MNRKKKLSVLDALTEEDKAEVQKLEDTGLSTEEAIAIYLKQDFL